MTRKRAPRLPNPALVAVRAASAQRIPYEVAHPRPAVTVRELRLRANRLAVILAALGDELSLLQRAVGASEVRPPGAPGLRMRSMTSAELAARVETPGWGEWADGDLDGA